jgi:hypothetical protein
MTNLNCVWDLGAREVAVGEVIGRWIDWLGLRLVGRYQLQAVEEVAVSIQKQ